jgi:deoxycytidylate deaminase
MTRHNITAIIFDKRKRPISIGKNSYVKTHPLQAKSALAAGMPQCIYLHAEVAALVALKDWSRASSILVSRVRGDGSIGSAKPCALCIRLIKLAGIKHVNHT